MSTDDQSGGEYCNSCGKPAFACSTDTLAALLDDALAANWTFSQGYDRIGVVNRLVKAGVVVLPADHPLRTGEPSEAMVEAGLRALVLLVPPPYDDTDEVALKDEVRSVLRAALAVIKEDLK